MLLIYGLVSKAYSHPAIRLKKLPVTGWLVAGLFQGLFTFVMCYIGINKYSMENVFKLHVLVPGVLSTVMLWANYPMTQIYQHEEDEKHGDVTLSRKLGIRGTFYFVSASVQPCNLRLCPVLPLFFRNKICLDVFSRTLSSRGVFFYLVLSSLSGSKKSGL